MECSNAVNYFSVAFFVAGIIVGLILCWCILPEFNRSKEKKE